MSDEREIRRRDFVRICATTATVVGASPALLASAGEAYQPHPRARLASTDGTPLRLEQLVAGESYVFNYPYVTTPCFLLQLGKPARSGKALATSDGRSYRWPGGIGPQQSVVAFCGICTHKLSHPSRAVSFINYRHEPVSFVDEREQRAERGGIIYCCSERSVYDPADGARVLGGPAPQPLAAIALEHDPADDSLYATGTWGQEVFERFFEAHSFRLALEYAVDDPRAPVGAVTRVRSISDYSRSQMMC